MEESHLFDKVPGRSRFLQVPVILFGGVGEVEEARRGVVRSTQSQWTGQTRSMDVLTEENTAMYSRMRRRLLIMVPDNRVLKKLPPVINLTGSNPINLGWCAVIGMLRTIWHETHQGQMRQRTDPKWSGCMR